MCGFVRARARAQQLKSSFSIILLTHSFKWALFSLVEFVDGLSGIRSFLGWKPAHQCPLYDDLSYASLIFYFLIAMNMILSLKVKQ